MHAFLSSPGAVVLRHPPLPVSRLPCLPLPPANVPLVCTACTAAALRGNEEVRTLELSYNPIGAEGAKAFADIIKYDMKVGG